MSTGIIFASIALYKIRTFQVSDLDDEYSGQNYIAFRLITIAAGIVFCFFYLSLAVNSESYMGVSLLYLAFKADETFSDVLYGIEQRHGRMDYIGKSQLMRGAASLIGFSVPLAVSGNLLLAIASMTLCCMIITYGYDLRKAKKFGSIRPSIRKTKAISLAKACFFAMLGSLLANSIVSVVRQYFGLAYGDEALGIYASIATPAILIQVAASYLYSPMIGSLARSWRIDSMTQFRARFGKVLAAIAAVVVLLVALLSLIGNDLLVLVFGPGIAPYTYIFPFVLIATGAVGLLFYANDVLIVLRQTKAMLVCNALALLLSLACAVVMVPSVGMNGLNYSIIIGTLFGALACCLVVLRVSR